LAHKINIPADNLKTTVEVFNNAVTTQNDEAFQRSCLEDAITEAPFYAVLVHASSLISFGGLKVNEQLQVVDKNDAPIQNLYAAGEILGAGATSGNAFCGGMVLTPAISFGKWLGETL
jgi:predicted oxidoreductase